MSDKTTKSNFFKNNLRSLRKRNHLTQEQLAERCDLSTISIIRYESGERLPNYEALIKFKNYFEIPIDELIGNVQDSVNFKNREENIKMDEVNVVLSLRRVKDLFNSLNSELIEKKDELKRMQEYNETIKSEYPFITDVLEDYVSELEQDLESLKQALEQ